MTETIPRSIDSTDTGKRRRLLILLASRSVVMTTLLGSTIFFKLKAGVPGTSLTQIILYTTVVAVYLITGGYYLFLRSASDRIRIFLHVQVNISFDVMIATTLVYLTGGVESPFTFLYALPIIHAAVYYPYIGTFLTAGLSCLFLGALLILEQQEIIPVNLESHTNNPPSGVRVIYLLALNYTVFAAIAWLASYLGEQLRRTGDKLRSTESDLEKVTALNRDIIISLRSGLMALDPKRCISLLNPVGEEILGVSAATAMRQPVEEIFPALLSLLDQDWSEDYNRMEVNHIRPTDGATVPIGLTLSNLKSPDNHQAGILVHLQDLTHRKEMEASVKRAERMAVLGTMAAAMAHEIRNPLASISGSVQMMKRNESTDRQARQLMDIVIRETKRLDNLLADFLLYTRPKAPRPIVCNFKELVEETVSVFLQQSDHDSVEITCKLDQIKADLDADQLRQVLWNLLSNAANAIGYHGNITVSTSCLQASNSTQWIVLEISDEGPGVPPELRDRVFDPFFTTKENGTGLGLATVSRIVTDHGGSIQLDCPKEGGSRFIIFLPGVCHE